MPFDSIVKQAEGGYNRSEIKKAGAEIDAKLQAKYDNYENAPQADKAAAAKEVQDLIKKMNKEIQDFHDAAEQQNDAHKNDVINSIINANRTGFLRLSNNPDYARLRQKIINNRAAIQAIAPDLAKQLDTSSVEKTIISSIDIIGHASDAGINAIAYAAAKSPEIFKELRDVCAACGTKFDANVMQAIVTIQMILRRYEQYAGRKYGVDAIAGPYTVKALDFVIGILLSNPSAYLQATPANEVTAGGGSNENPTGTSERPNNGTENTETLHQTWEVNAAPIFPYGNNFMYQVGKRQDGKFYEKSGSQQREVFVEKATKTSTGSRQFNTLSSANNSHTFLLTKGNLQNAQEFVMLKEKNNQGEVRYRVYGDNNYIFKLDGDNILVQEGNQRKTLGKTNLTTGATPVFTYNGIKIEPIMHGNELLGFSEEGKAISTTPNTPIAGGGDSPENDNSNPQENENDTLPTVANTTETVPTRANALPLSNETKQAIEALKEKGEVLKKLTESIEISQEDKDGKRYIYKILPGKVYLPLGEIQKDDQGNIPDKIDITLVTTRSGKKLPITIDTQKALNGQLDFDVSAENAKEIVDLNSKMNEDLKKLSMTGAYVKPFQNLPLALDAYARGDATLQEKPLIQELNHFGLKNLILDNNQTLAIGWNYKDDRSMNMPTIYNNNVLKDPNQESFVTPENDPERKNFYYQNADGSKFNIFVEKGTNTERPYQIQVNKLDTNNDSFIPTTLFNKEELTVSLAKQPRSTSFEATAIKGAETVNHKIDFGYIAHKVQGGTVKLYSQDGLPLADLAYEADPNNNDKIDALVDNVDDIEVFDDKLLPTYLRQRFDRDQLKTLYDQYDFGIKDNIKNTLLATDDIIKLEKNGVVGYYHVEGAVDNSAYDTTGKTKIDLKPHTEINQLIEKHNQQFGNFLMKVMEVTSIKLGKGQNDIQASEIKRGLATTPPQVSLLSFDEAMSITQTNEDGEEIKVYDPVQYVNNAIINDQLTEKQKQGDYTNVQIKQMLDFKQELGNNNDDIHFVHTLNNKAVAKTRREGKDDELYFLIEGSDERFTATVPQGNKQLNIKLESTEKIETLKGLLSRQEWNEKVAQPFKLNKTREVIAIEFYDNLLKAVDNDPNVDLTKVNAGLAMFGTQFKNKIAKQNVERGLFYLNGEKAGDIGSANIHLNKHLQKANADYIIQNNVMKKINSAATQPDPLSNQTIQRATTNNMTKAIDAKKATMTPKELEKARKMYQIPDKLEKDLKNDLGLTDADLYTDQNSLMNQVSINHPEYDFEKNPNANRAKFWRLLRRKWVLLDKMQKTMYYKGKGNRVVPLAKQDSSPIFGQVKGDPQNKAMMIQFLAKKFDEAPQLSKKITLEVDGKPLTFDATFAFDAQGRDKIGGIKLISINNNAINKRSAITTITSQDGTTYKLHYTIHKQEKAFKIEKT